MFLHLHKVHLLILAQQGQGGHQPPDGGDQEGKVQRCHLGDTDAPGPQHQRQTDHKGHTAANVTPGIAFGGNLIHPVRHSHIAEHGVIEHQTARKAHLGKDEDEQERQPGACHPHGAAADHAHCHAEGEDGLFEVAGIRQCAKDRAEHRRDDCDRRGCIAPVGRYSTELRPPPSASALKKMGISVATSSTNAELPTSYKIHARSRLVRRNFCFASFICIPLKILRRCGHRPCPAVRRWRALPHIP